MSNTRWSVVIPEDTDRALRTYLARKGTGKGDLSRFVDEAVLSHLFELTCLPWKFLLTPMTTGTRDGCCR